MAQRKINLLSKRDRKILPSDLFSFQATRVKRAAEILEDEFNIFINDMLSKSANPAYSPVKDWHVKIDVTPEASFRGGVISSYTMQIDNPVFNILSEGTDPKDYPRNASDYGLKAFPLYAPRAARFGNRPMSKPNSLDLQKAQVNGEVLIFRSVIKRPIKARNFTKLIYERAQKKINTEDLRIQLQLTDV